MNRGEPAYTEVKLSILEGILKKGVPYGTMWHVRGQSGTGKSTLAFQFMMQGLRRGESAVFVACDEPVDVVRSEISAFGFNVSSYEEKGLLQFVETFESESGVSIADPSDSQEFLYVLVDLVHRMPRPCRVVIDSMSSLAVNYPPHQFIALVHQKNRLLRSSGVVVLDLYVFGTLQDNGMYKLANAYDVCIDLYYPEEKSVVPQRSLRVHKVRMVGFDPRPFPYSIRPGHGLVVDRDFYSR